MIHWSASRAGFLHGGIHDLPDDAVPVSDKRHRALLAGNARGGRIVSDARGRPRLEMPASRIEAIRAAKTRAIKAEARRRILAIAPLHRQANDNAALAAAALVGHLNELANAALDRRARIDAIRARSNEIEALLADLERPALEAFNPVENALWETVP
ncbi:MAG: hypothetical protein A4S12_07020 [Proteobacteria bacterium SG_bin5]|nr:hypothetical protein [Sphingomonas sp.]OQW42084.1 MAG: hypothetical protein A4S12_07020 [Proteobacteria bacterium SG_bin5]